MIKPSVIAAAALALYGLGVIALSGNGLRASAATPLPIWTEVPWPFPMDQWGKGKAFSCTAADCGAPVTVYIRAKIGFCNCSTGVADDQELAARAAQTGGVLLETRQYHHVALAEEFRAELLGIAIARLVALGAHRILLLGMSGYRNNRRAGDDGDGREKSNSSGEHELPP